jgi:hypothetical protein
VIKLHLCFAFGVVAALSAQPTAPKELTALMAKTRVDGKLTSWCSGEFRVGRRDAFAAAVTSSTGGGRYLLLDADGTVVELAPFKDAPDLACYTPAEARTLSESIRNSQTISGGVAPTFTTTVVCGFVDNTSAVCWQYSPTARAFVKVGEWQT